MYHECIPLAYSSLCLATRAFETSKRALRISYSSTGYRFSQRDTKAAKSPSSSGVTAAKVAISAEVSMLGIVEELKPEGPRRLYR